VEIVKQAPKDTTPIQQIESEPHLRLVKNQPFVITQDYWDQFKEKKEAKLNRIRQARETYLELQFSLNAAKNIVFQSIDCIGKIVTCERENEKPVHGVLVGLKNEDTRAPSFTQNELYIKEPSSDEPTTLAVKQVGSVALFDTDQLPFLWEGDQT
jgi:hypothetical protein